MRDPLLYLAEDYHGDLALWLPMPNGADALVLYRHNAGECAWALIEEALVARLRDRPSRERTIAALYERDVARLDARNATRERDAAHVEVAARTAERDAARATIHRVRAARDDWEAAHEGASANGARLGEENARLRAQLAAARADAIEDVAGPLRDEIETLRELNDSLLGEELRANEAEAALREAKAEIARLRLGEAEEPVEEYRRTATPAQMLRQLNDAGPAFRLCWASEALRAFDTAHECNVGPHLRSHASQIEDLKARGPRFLARRAASYEGSADRLAANGFGSDASALRTVAKELREVAKELG